MYYWGLGGLFCVVLCYGLYRTWLEKYIKRLLHNRKKQNQNMKNYYESLFGYGRLHHELKRSFGEDFMLFVRYTQNDHYEAYSLKKSSSITKTLCRIPEEIITLTDAKNHTDHMYSDLDHGDLIEYCIKPSDEELRDFRSKLKYKHYKICFMDFKNLELHIYRPCGYGMRGFADYVELHTHMTNPSVKFH